MNRKKVCALIIWHASSLLSWAAPRKTKMERIKRGIPSWSTSANRGPHPSPVNTNTHVHSGIISLTSSTVRMLKCKHTNTWRSLSLCSSDSIDLFLSSVCPFIVFAGLLIDLCDFRCVWSLWFHCFWLVHFGLVAFHVPLSPTEGIYVFIILLLLNSAFH